MKTGKAPFLFSVARLYCSVFSHRFHVSNFITEHIKEYQCHRCGEEITDTANGSLAKLTTQVKETNAYLAQFHQRRSRKFSEA